MDNAKAAFRSTLVNATNKCQDSVWVSEGRLRRLGKDEVLHAPYTVRSMETKTSSEVASTIQHYPSQALHQHLTQNMAAIGLPPPVLFQRVSEASGLVKLGKACAHHVSGADQWRFLADAGFGLGTQYKNTQTTAELRIDEENVSDGTSIVFGCVTDWTYSGGLKTTTLSCVNGHWQLAYPDAFGKSSTSTPVVLTSDAVLCTL